MSYEFSEIMEPGDPVDLDILTSDNQILKLKCNVQLVKGAAEVLVTAPIHQGHVYPIHVGTMVMVTLAQDETGVYTFYATVIRRFEADGKRLMHLKKGSEVKKSQRRRYFRLPFIGRIRVVDPNQPELSELEKKELERLKSKYSGNPHVIIDDEPEIKYIEMMGRDLSGGGFRAISQSPVELGTDIEGQLLLDDAEVSFSGRVVRCKETLDVLKSYEVGVMFEMMDDQVRSQIISFIFRKQRNMRNKGLV